MMSIQWVGVMTQISGCDVTCIGYMLPYIMDVVSYIEFVMSKVQQRDNIRSNMILYGVHMLSHIEWV